MSKWLWLVVGVLAVLLGSGLWLVNYINALEVDRVTEDLHMIRGFGGNVGVLSTGVGTVIVDTMTFESQGEAIRELAEDLTGEPVILVVNTHYHGDHTHGNPAFDDGTRVVATERTREHLLTYDADYWQGANEALLPNETFHDQHTITLGGKTVHLVHPGPGHTDGDLVALFVEDRAVHLGDLYFNRLYPNIDLEAGGTVQRWGDTLDRVLLLPFEHVIPGHGPVSDAAGLRDFQRFIRQLAEVGRAAAANGWTREQTIERGALTEDAGYGTIEIPLVMALDREFVLTRAWEEATGAVPPPAP